MLLLDQIRCLVQGFSLLQLRAALSDGIVTPDDLPEILGQAVFMKRVDVVDGLLDGGFIGVNVRNRNGLAPLEIAIETLDKQVVSHLLDKGAQMNGTGANGLTPLHAAIDTEVEAALCDRDRTGTNVAPASIISTLLLERGADKRARSIRGETPLDFARRRGHLTAAAILQ